MVNGAHIFKVNSRIRLYMEITFIEKERNETFAVGNES